MAGVTQEVALAATPERVWDFITAVRYWPLWLEGVARAQAISTPQTRPGTTFELMRRRAHDAEAWIVAEWDRPRRVRFTEYRRDQHLIFEVETAPGGTRLIARREWPTGRGLLRLLPTRSDPSLARSLTKLRDMIALNQDIKLLHGMGDE